MIVFGYIWLYVTMDQIRHEWKTLRSSSEYKLTIPEYIKARPQFWANERPFLKRIGVIRRRPQGYDPLTHREIWETANWKVDGKMVINFDEVPYTLDYTTKQLVARGERITLTKNAFKRLQKYRQGTIGMFVTPFEVLCIVIIYRKAGGPLVQHRLKHLEHTDNSKVFMMGSEKGTMNRKLWPHALKALADCTKERRGTADLVDGDWKYGVVLYVDSYAVHLDRKLALEFAEKYGIFIRPLLRNASHLMQPVDRNIGVAFKSRYKHILMGHNYKLLHLLSLNLEDHEMSLAKYHELCTGAINTVFLAVYVHVYITLYVII